MSHDLNIPVHLKWEPDAFQWRWQAHEGELLFRRDRRKGLKIDPWEFRGDFLRVNPTAREFARLLDHYRAHPFPYSTNPADWPVPPTNFVDLADGILHRTASLDPSILADAQSVLKDFLQNPGKYGSDQGDIVVRLRDWEFGLMGWVEWHNGMPAFSVEPYQLFECLIWTVIFDNMQGFKFRICQRPDCRAPFQLTSRRPRKYCSYACAHLMTVRKSRRPKGKKLKNGGK